MLRCTGRAYPLRPIRARPGRPVAADLALPGPGIPRFLLLRRRRAGARTRDAASTSTSSGSSPRSVARIPADPALPIPSNAHWMPLASLVQVPFMAVLGTDGLGVGAAVRADRALAAPLTWAIARDARRPADRRPRRRHPRRRSRCCRPCTWSSPTTSRSTSRWSSGRCGWPPAACAVRRALVRRSPACSPASPRCRATTACCVLGGARARLRLGPLAAPARGRLAAGIPSGGRRLRRGSSSWSWRRGGLRQLAVFGSLSPSTASGKVLFIRDIGEWNSITTPASLEHLLGMGIGPLIASRIGGLVAAVMIYVDARRPASSWPRSWSSVAGRAGARSTSAPFFVVCRPAVRVLGARLGRPRPGRHVHPFGGRPGAARLHPRARRASPSASRGSRRAGSTWHVGRRDRPSSPAAALVFAVGAAAVGSAFVHGVWADGRDQVPARRERPRCGAAPRRRTASCRSTPPARLLDRSRRGGPGQRPARDHPRGRPRVRHPLARPRPRRQRRLRSRRSSTACRGRLARRADPRPRASRRPSASTRAGVRIVSRRELS